MSEPSPVYTAQSMDKRKPLTPAQMRTLRIISWYIGEHGYPPSLRDINMLGGTSSTSVPRFHLRALERKGYIRRDALISRSIVILPAEYEGE